MNDGKIIWQKPIKSQFFILKDFGPFVINEETSRTTAEQLGKNLGFTGEVIELRLIKESKTD